MAYKDKEKQREASLASYHRRRKSDIERMRLVKNEAKKRRRKENSEYVNALKAQPCVDCGNCYLPCVMDFDHVRGEKTKNIAFMLINDTSLEKIKEEIEKCELVCSNCHRIRTHQRRYSANG